MSRPLSAFLAVVPLVCAPIAVTAATHMVTQSNFGFVPNDLAIEVGDTVEWIWTGGGHTVTNGVHPDSAGTGDLFDAPLNVISPTFSFTFTAAGDVPYFCTPHFLFGMTGTVRVGVTAVEEGRKASSFSRVKDLYR
jgi:plastocyanin